MNAQPPYSKTILCLANSRRPGGTCFAGKEFTAGSAGVWLRPVDSANSGAISVANRTYPDGSHADLLDIASVPLSRPNPHLHHKEDHEIAAGSRWTKTGRASWDDVVRATDNVAGHLWNHGDSSYHGINDKVSEASAAALAGSLYLINPANLELVVALESVFQGQSVRKVRASFHYNGSPYNFVVTDEPVEMNYLAKGDGRYKIDNARLCISLAEILHGSATKLVAAVITPDRV
jgi:hypothetical protein